eukprot:PhF_6_TR24915/c0_g1_i1/m.34300
MSQNESSSTLLFRPPPGGVFELPQISLTVTESPYLADTLDTTTTTTIQPQTQDLSFLTAPDAVHGAKSQSESTNGVVNGTAVQNGGGQSATEKSVSHEIDYTFLLPNTFEGRIDFRPRLLS